MAPWVLFFVLERYGRIEKILADKGYREDLVNDLKMVYGVELEISNRISVSRC